MFEVTDAHRAVLFTAFVSKEHREKNAVAGHVRDHDATTTKGTKGLFKISRKAQDSFQEFFFPTKARSPLLARMFEAIVSVAETTDRWMRARDARTADAIG